MNKIFNKFNIIYFVIIVLSILSVVIVNYDYSFYDKTIVKITNIKTDKTDVSTNYLGFEEQYYEQTITGKIMNGDKIGEEVSLTNEYSYSLVASEKYNKGDDIFVSSSGIDGLKRDKYVVLMLVIFINALFLIGKFRGLLAILSVVVNISIFTIGLTMYSNGKSLLLICMIESIFFTIFSLIMASGFNKKSLSAIISVFVSLIILLILTYLIVITTDYGGINFADMSFLTVPIEDVFMASLILGGLGAVMDISITMSSSISELIEKNKKISNKSLIKSGKEIGKDIFSTMINVLFFSYLCGGLPLFVLALRNGYTLSNYISSNFSIEIARFLVGSIGIVLAIPVALYISIFILRRGESHE